MILVSIYGSIQYGPGPLLIWKNFRSQMPLDHKWGACWLNAPGAVWISHQVSFTLFKTINWASTVTGCWKQTRYASKSYMTSVNDIVTLSSILIASYIIWLSKVDLSTSLSYYAYFLHIIKEITEVLKKVEQFYTRVKFDTKSH